MYIVVTGHVRVHDDEKQLARLGPDSYFGELTLLDSEPRSASITCESAVRALRLEQQDLYDLMRYETGLTLGIMSSLVGRIRLFTEYDR
jgi:CRP-like cAMP-binding protein